MLFSCKNFLQGSNLQNEITKEVVIANSEKPVFISKLPEYKESGNYKNATISVTYTHNIPLSNFRFTEDELKNLGCLDENGKPTPDYIIDDSCKDSNGLIYKYIYQQKDYFKNITITDAANNSLCSYYNAPEVFYNNSKNETTVQIPANEFNLIPVENGVLDIHVNFSKLIEDSEGIPTLNNINWQYNALNKLDQEKPVLFLDTVLGSRLEDVTMRKTPVLEKSEENTLFFQNYAMPYNKGTVFKSFYDFLPKIRNIFYPGQIPAYTENGSNDDEFFNNNKTLIDFFTVNHIKDIAYFYLEGHDYGSKKFYAKITCKRITNEYGDSDIEEYPIQLIEIDTSAVPGTYRNSKSFKLDLSNSESKDSKSNTPDYKDGLYFVEIQLQDTSSNLSDEKAEFYILRDTKVTTDFGQVFFQNYYSDMKVDFPADHYTRLNLSFDNNGELLKNGENGNTYSGDNAVANDYMWDYYEENGIKYYRTASEPTASYISERRNTISIDNIKDDDFYTYKNLKIYTKRDRYIFTYDYGFSKNEIVESNIPLIVNKWGPNKEDIEYFFLNRDENWNLDLSKPNLLTFSDNNADKEIYIRINVFDEVGNSLSTDIYLPPKAKLIDYKFEQESEPESGKIKLNITDQTKFDWNKKLQLSNFDVKLNYKVFYTQTDTQVDLNDSTTYFKRNFKEILYEGDISDSFEIPAIAGKNYSVLIRSEFQFFSKSNGGFAGKLTGPISIINNLKATDQGSSTFSARGFKENTLNAEIKGLNSGLTTITAKIDNYDSNYNYNLIYTTNGINYSTINTQIDSNGNITAVIPTPLIPPVYSYWDEKTEDFYIPNQPQDKWFNDFPIIDFDTEVRHKTHDSNKNGGRYNSPYSPYTTTVSFKLLTSNGKETKESQKYDLQFDEDDDNTPPYFNYWKNSHDLALSPDGNYLYSPNACIVDNEWHLNKTFTFYFTPYKDSWGNRLNMLSKEEILALPDKGIGEVIPHYSLSRKVKEYANEYGGSWRISSFIDYESLEDYEKSEVSEEEYYANSEKHKFKTYLEYEQIMEYNELYIPTYYFAPGEYMIFGQFKDKNGNESVLAIGKIHIKNFNTNLINEYKDSTLTTKLDISDANSFDESIITIQYLNSNSWKDFFPIDKYYYQLNYRNFDNNNIYNVSDNLIKDTFYKITAQCRNIDYTTKIFLDTTYDESYWNMGDNKLTDEITQKEVDDYRDMYGDIGSDWDIKCQIAYDKGLYSDSAYDYYTQETLTAPSYIYVTDSSESLEDDEKNFISGEYAVEIRCSKPTLVEFISSPIDLGDSIDRWCQFGTAVDIQRYDSLPTSTLLKSQKLIKGEYYVVVAHFADGSQNISKVYEK